MADVFLRHPSQHGLFLEINGHFRWLKAARTACFYLNKAKPVAIPSNQIDISAQFRATPASRNNRVAKSAEMEICGIFAAHPGQQMGGMVWGPSGARSLLIEPTKRSFENGQARLRDT